MGTSPANIGTSKSRKPSKMPFGKMRLLILEYCDQWRSLEQIANYTERTKEYLGTFILPKLSEDLCKRFPPKESPQPKCIEGETYKSPIASDPDMMGRTKKPALTSQGSSGRESV